MHGRVRWMVDEQEDEDGSGCTGTDDGADATETAGRAYFPL